MYSMADSNPIFCGFSIDSHLPQEYKSEHGDETCPLGGLGGFVTGGRRGEASQRRDGGPKSGSGALEVPGPLSSPVDSPLGFDGCSWRARRAGQALTGAHPRAERFPGSMVCVELARGSARPRRGRERGGVSPLGRATRRCNREIGEAACSGRLRPWGGRERTGDDERNSGTRSASVGR